MYFDPYPTSYYRNALQSILLNASSGPINPLKGEKHGVALTSYSIVAYAPGAAILPGAGRSVSRAAHPTKKNIN